MASAADKAGFGRVRMHDLRAFASHQTIQAHERFQLPRSEAELADDLRENGRLYPMRQGIVQHRSLARIFAIGDQLTTGRHGWQAHRC
jgi:hypothetical protein